MSRPEAQNQPSADGVDWRKLIDSKITLGPLMKDFQQRTNAHDSDGFAGYLEKLVQERNDVVHHILSDPAHPLLTNADVMRTIEVLRQYIRSSALFLQALQSATAQFADAIDNSPTMNRHLATLEFPIKIEHPR